MDNKFNEGTPQRPAGDRVIDAPLVSIDLPFYIKEIKEESTWKESDRNAITLYKTDGMRIVLIAMHIGAEMAKHTANGVINVQLIDGKIGFKTDDRSVELTKGQILTLHKNIPHSVTALEESVFLLTLNTSPDQAFL